MKKFICLVLLFVGVALTVSAYPDDSTNVVQTEFQVPAVMPEPEVFHFSTAEWICFAPQVQVVKTVHLVKKTLEGYPDIEETPPVMI